MTMSQKKPHAETRSRGDSNKYFVIRCSSAQTDSVLKTESVLPFYFLGCFWTALGPGMPSANLSTSLSWYFFFMTSNSESIIWRTLA